MFVIGFAFALIAVSYVSAEIPSYINVCSRRDPKLDQCIKKNIDNIKNKICDGIPELDIPSNNPFFLDKLVISDTTNTKISLKNSEVLGICDFEIKYLHMDIDKLHCDIDLLFRRFQLNATYDFNIRLLVPIIQTELVYLTTDNVDAKINLDMKVITKSGIRYMYLSKMKINLDIKGYNAEYGLNNTELSRLNEIISNFIGNNQEEVIKAFKPAIEEAVVKRILLLSNNIVKHFTFEELFPDTV